MEGFVCFCFWLLFLLRCQKVEARALAEGDVDDLKTEVMMLTRSLGAQNDGIRETWWDGQVHQAPT